MGDYYTILGVSKDASDEQIKNAYRKLAREHHPDKGGDTSKFQQIQEAYETLSDPQKKQSYDNPNSGMPQFGGFNFNVNDFFGGGNNSNGIVRKGDHNYICKITLKDVFFGIKKRFKVKREKICKICSKKCNNCGGTGNIQQRIQMGPFTQVIQHNCNGCGGKGIMAQDSKCEHCNSKGIILEERIIEIDIPKGIENGKQYIYEEWGEQAIKENEISGSLIVTINVEEHTLFKRNNLDLLITINLTLVESIIGKKLTIEHFDGELMIDTKGFGIINPHKQYSLYNRGIENSGGKRGKLNILFKIIYPERALDDNQIIILRDAFKQVSLS